MSSESSFIAAPMRVPTASVRRAARAFEATTSAFTLPPVIVAYDVDDAERALLAHGFVPNDPECAELALVGFDVETRPNFVRGERNSNAPALVQVANERACVLVHLASMRGETPPALRALCEDARTLFVGTAVKTDMEDVDATCGTKSVGFVDTGVIAKTFGHEKIGLKAMSARYGYDAEKPKSVQTSNWERAPLNRRQIEYGAIDAALGLWVLKRMHAEYGAGEEGTSLMAWAEAFAEAETPKEARRRARERANSTPACVVRAFETFKKKEDETAREAWLVKRGKSAANVFHQLGRGALHPVSAAHNLMSILRSPRTNEKFIQWVVGEREDDHVTVVLKLGSFASGSGRARSVKAAKTEAAAAAFGAVGGAKDQVDRWIRRELERAFGA